MLEINSHIKLTQYAHGAGCGCKIAPQVLHEIIQASGASSIHKNLLVGNSSNDDAAVYDLGNGKALIATTDFFMPIVDDPYDFGRIAAANAISDVYAMGGTPSLALAILGWPIDKLAPVIAAEVMKGAKAICEEAGIPLAGGHSIDTLEPMFGLSVNGLVQKEHLKKNNTAKEGDHIFLTKAIGVGILATAQKRGLLKEEDQKNLIDQLSALNKIGEKLGKIAGVTAMTDVTGFGLMGHLIEMCEGSHLTAEVTYSAIPKLKCLPDYLSQNVLPDATFRNWNAYQNKVKIESTVDMNEAFMVLPDPQTNGGLLFTAQEEALEQLNGLLKECGLSEFSQPIGRMCKKTDVALIVI